MAEERKVKFGRGMEGCGIFKCQRHARTRVAIESLLQPLTSKSTGRPVIFRNEQHRLAASTAVKLLLTPYCWCLGRTECDCASLATHRRQELQAAFAVRAACRAAWARLPTGNGRLCKRYR